MTNTTERGTPLPPEIMDDLTRREFLIGAGLIALAPSCGSGEEAGEETSANTRTIKHKFGVTEIPGGLSRVVSIGYNDHDAILALGMKPVAVRYWFGDENDVIFPWAEDTFASSEGPEEDTEILNMPEALNFEKIATLEPNLVVGLYSGMSEDDYGTLSEIAPTVAQSDEYVDYGMPWQDTTMMIGRALGRSEQAAEVVADVEAQFAAIREQHPEFKGKSIVVASSSGEDQYDFNASEDVRSRIFTQLGFEVPAELDEIAGEDYYANISGERLDLLDRDILVRQLNPGDSRADIEERPLVQKLDAIRENRTIFVEGDLYDALGFSTVLSIPYLLEELVPQLAAAIDGDPETEATE